MRRFLIACFFFSLAITLLCHVQVVGFILKIAARGCADSLLAFRTLRIDNKALFLEDVILLDIKGNKSSYFLQSEEVKVEMAWTWPLSFSIHLVKPRVVISAEQMQGIELASRSYVRWSVEMEEGLLEWADHHAPSSQFSLLVTSDQTLQMGMSWERGVLELEKNGPLYQGTWNDLPLDIASKYLSWSGWVYPLSNLQGTLSGSIEIDGQEKRACFTVCGKNLGCEWGKLDYRGNIVADGVWRCGTMEKIILSVEEGNILSATAAVQHLGARLTYHAHLGIKCEGEGVASKDSLEMPLEWEGKGCFAKGPLLWASGRTRLGKMSGRFSWSEREKLFAWEELGVEEVGLLQGFVDHWIPGIKEWSWCAGVSRGIMSFTDDHFPHLTHLEINDWHLQKGSIQLNAERLTHTNDSWEIGNLELSYLETELQGNAKCLVKNHALEGELAGVEFAGNWDWDGRHFSLSIPHITGDIPTSLCSFASGKIVGEECGFELKGSWSGIEHWKFMCQIKDGKLDFSHCILSNIQCNFLADSDAVNLLAVKGAVAFNVAGQHLDATLFVPKACWQGENTWFDVRLSKESIDLLRLKGSKEGEHVELDSTYSHLLGEPLFLREVLWPKGSFPSFTFETEIDGALLQPYLWQKLPSLGRISTIGYWGKGGGGFSFQTSDWSLQVDNHNMLLDCHLSFGPYSIRGLVEQTKGIFKVKGGHVQSPDLFCDFEGKINRQWEGNIMLRSLRAEGGNLPFLPSFEGSLTGQAEMHFTSSEIEADLDLLLKDGVWNGFALENTGPLHVYYSSLRGILVKGVDCSLHKGPWEAHAKIDLVEFDQLHHQWNVQKAKAHFPTDWLVDRIEFPWLERGENIDCLGDISFAADFANWSCTVKEGLVPISGTIHHVQNFRASLLNSNIMVKALVDHKGKWAHVSFGMSSEEQSRHGTLLLEERGQTEEGLTFYWSYEKPLGILVDAVEGSFGGLNASFYAVEKGRLMGACQIDFHHLAEWVPSNVAKSFQELKMGYGYALKGNLQIDPHQAPNISFQGIFSGKQLALAGFELNTLLGNADFHFAFRGEGSSWVHVDHLKISDPAAILHIEEIWIRGEHQKPWTVEMPQFVIQELRPSLLIRPGRERGAISPLLVRQLTMRGFSGLLEDGSSYHATGDLSFINSFKREQTVFDLPANVFGRIIGLDLELLIPVKGELTFVLKDGYFHLGDLKDSYSEGGRSAFFLVQSDPDQPRMDLDGNLHILVKMKQFVLFSLTEAFMISIDGKLNDPHFRLQKKKRFL